MSLENIGVFLVLASILFGFLGLISPRLAIFWGKRESKTRGKVLVFYFLLAVAGVILVGVSPHNKIEADTNQNTEQLATADTQKPTKHLTKKEQESKKKANAVKAAEELAKKKAEEKADAAKAAKELAKKEAENKQLLEEMSEIIDKSMLERMKKAGTLTDVQSVIDYYKAAKEKRQEINSEIKDFESDKREYNAKIEALTTEEHSYFLSARSHLSAKLINKAEDTAFGSGQESELVISNKEIDKLFEDDFEIQSIYVYALFAEPLFGFPVHVEIADVDELEPGETEVLDITSDYGGLILADLWLCPTQAYKKGTVTDSEAFDF